MRVAAIFCVLMLGATLAHAQTGHEWINFSQSYYKVPVAKDGIYKLTYLDLQNAGVPVNTIDPRTIQVFHRGAEQAILVNGEDDDQFNPVDFIEFYGRRNDGTLDAELYKPSSLQPHSYYNLYNDTTGYFITFNGTAGKRMAVVDETNTGGIPSDEYHNDQKMMLLTSQYSTGFTVGDMLNSYSDEGEGWTGAGLRQGQSADYTFTGLLNSFPSAGQPQLELLLVGRFSGTQLAEISVGADASSLRIVSTAAFNGFSTYKVSEALNWSDVGADGNLVVRVKATIAGAFLSASYIQVSYPQRFNQAGAAEKVFNLGANASGKSYIEITNAPSGTRLFDVSDPTNVVLLKTTGNTTLNAIVPSTIAARRIYAANTTITPAVKSVQFRQINPSEYNYIIISHKLLMKSAGSYANPVQAYADYRASTAGGSFKPLVVDVNMLYDQFSSGESTPVAISRFMRFLCSTHTPDYLLLIGKGLDVNYNYYRNPVPFTAYKDLVPSAGLPASDIAYTAGLNGTTYEPAVATGRLPAMKPVDVASYLDKVKETEALPFNALWRKNLLHLSGGLEEGEPEKFRGYLKAFGDVAEDYYFGGKVSARAKRSRGIEQNIDVSAEVNKGVSLITFFGHSSPSTLDFDVGYVTNPVLGYHNKGKYPMFLINGCNAGSFFLYNELFGANWINTPDKGALGFIAHTYYGLESITRGYSDVFYKTAFADSVLLKKGIGDIHKETAKRFMDATIHVVETTTQTQQMILLGDPAVKLFGAKKPDYEINADNLTIQSLDDNPVTALSDSFAVNIIVRNFGIALPDTFNIEVQRKFNNGVTVTYDSLFSGVLYGDTLSIIIRKDRNSPQGNNEFIVTIDPDNVIAELDETNNTATLGLFIPLNGTRNLFPSHFSIINTKSPTLSFQCTDLFASERDFSVELDTVNTFDSPFKKSFTVKGKVLAKQIVQLADDDSTAYYWRTRLTQVSPGESDQWTASSFTYIKDSPEGWAQLHFPQYLDNVANGLVRDTHVRRLEFPETVANVAIKTFGEAYPHSITDVSVKIAGAEYNLVDQGFVCRSNSINLIAFDRNSTTPYVGLALKWYNRADRACGRQPWVINNFRYNNMVTGSNDLIAYVNNIAEGDSVVLYSIANAQFSLWPNEAKVKLGEFGISVAQIESLIDGEPVVIFGRKGLAPGSASVIRSVGGAPTAQQLVVNKTITGRFVSGSMKTEAIGPASSWDKLVLNTETLSGSDRMTVDIVGVKLDGSESVIMNDINTATDLSAVNANVFPWLKLSYKTKDDIDLTPVQLNKWIVLYEPMAEGLLLYNGPRTTQQVEEGETWQGNYKFVNISNRNFTDSLTVNLDAYNTTLFQSLTNAFKIKAPPAGDTTSFKVSVNTISRPGLNDVNVFVNKRILPELYYDNNVLELPEYLQVFSDRYDPVLEVNIDGRRVANEDFVSPNPTIEVKLWDENRRKLKTDTTDVNMYLAYPCMSDECAFERIHFSRSDVSWHAATATTDFTTAFSPKGLPAGKYVLRVEASDANGNASGTEAYEITFNVSLESGVVVGDPFPNPTTGTSKLQVRISGSELPSNAALRIWSAAGVETREISSDAFYIGTNELAWDGKDSRGNAVPSGIYIYELKMTLGEQKIRRTGKIAVVR